MLAAHRLLLVQEVGSRPVRQFRLRQHQHFYHHSSRTIRQIPRRYSHHNHHPRFIVPPRRRIQGRTDTTGAAAVRRQSTTTTFRKRAWQEISTRPVEFVSIPCVAAFVGILTNWLGVKMLFYPIDYTTLPGLDVYRSGRSDSDDEKTTTQQQLTPYGFFGWQGVVPCKTDPMAKRLVHIITTKLLSLEEVFQRLDAPTLSRLLTPAIVDSLQHTLFVVAEEKTEEDNVNKGTGNTRLLHRWSAWTVQHVVAYLLPPIIERLQAEIDTVLQLEQVVLTAFVRDKATLVDLFQKVGRVELDFLVNSGFGLGFVLGLGQMVVWAGHPVTWTLPVAGALVGYVTNYIAIKFIFEPAEPVSICGGLFEVQGMFESRQVEVSEEFGDFMQHRVLTAAALLQDLARGGSDGDLYQFLRRQLPYPIPHAVVLAAVEGINKIAHDPIQYADVHTYINDRLDVRKTLAARLKLLSPTEFEDLLHPVFQEDEATLIATGGVLGFCAGALQTQLGWGGRHALPRAIGTIIFTLSASVCFYLEQEYAVATDAPLASDATAGRPPQLRRRETVVRRRRTNTVIVPEKDA